MNRAVRKSRNRDRSERRDFGRVLRYLATGVILCHGRDYRRITYESGRVELLSRLLGFQLGLMTAFNANRTHITL